jgi:hypothetical protein
MNTPYTIDEVKWAKLDIFNQMGNIYSEVGRSFKTKGQQNSEDHQQAVSRAIDLFDASIRVLIAQKSPKSKEVLRAKEQFLDIVLNDKATAEATQSLDRYFMQFAIAARLNR